MLFLLLLFGGFIGQGTVLEHDCGYSSWRLNPVTGKQEEVWTSVPTRCVFVGITDKELSEASRPPMPYLVFCKAGGQLNGQSVFIPLWGVRLSEIRRLKKGRISSIAVEDVEVEIHKE